jgi:nucleotide-binding universal stress UspA family protein
MKKKILIPTDFSKNAWNAITYASDLFKNQECMFYLMNSYAITGYVVGDMGVPEPGSKSYEKAGKLSQEGLDKVLEMLKFRNTTDKHTYKTISEFGDPFSVMQSIIMKKDIELVVMGTKGASNHSGALFGSNTITAMDEINECPVMGIPMDARLAVLKEIVFPTGFETHYKRKELVHLVKLARQQDAIICVLHVDPVEELSQKQKANKLLLSECLEGATYSFHHLSSANRNSAVLTFVESRNSDMVAIINKKHAFFEKIFTTPLVKELGMFSKVPLFVMHDLSN